MLEQVTIAVGVVGLLSVAMIGAATFVVVRGVRRRYRAVRARLQAVRSRQPDLGALFHESGAVAAASLGSPGWWSAQQQRHRMWRSVTSAEYAVGVARRADVPVGDLPEVARSLRAAAVEVDALLRAGGRLGSLQESDRAACDRIVTAAADLRDAALATLRAGSHADAETAASAVQIEVAALAAGLRAARA